MGKYQILVHIACKKIWKNRLYVLAKSDDSDSEYLAKESRFWFRIGSGTQLMMSETLRSSDASWDEAMYSTCTDLYFFSRQKAWLLYLKNTNSFSPKDPVTSWVSALLSTSFTVSWVHALSLWIHGCLRNYCTWVTWKNCEFLKNWEDGKSFRFIEFWPIEVKAIHVWNQNKFYEIYSCNTYQGL